MTKVLGWHLGTIPPPLAGQNNWELSQEQPREPEKSPRNSLQHKGLATLTWSSKVTSSLETPRLALAIPGWIIISFRNWEYRSLKEKKEEFAMRKIRSRWVHRHSSNRCLCPTLLSQKASDFLFSVTERVSAPGSWENSTFHTRTICFIKVLNYLKTILLLCRYLWKQRDKYQHPHLCFFSKELHKAFSKGR